MISPSRRVILASATGYTWAQIAPFVRSLRSTGYNGDFVLLVGHLSTADKIEMRRAGIKLWFIRTRMHQPVYRRPRFLFNRRLAGFYRALASLCDALPGSSHRRRLIKARVFRPFHHIACSRYFFYYSWLHAHAGDYDEIMLSDVRDVIFQADPFSSPLSSPLRFFLEHRSMTVGGQINNAQWVGHAYGPGILGRIGHRPVSCSGITYGTTAGMLDYLAAMTDELIDRTHPIGGADGFDQGVHNYLIWENRFPLAELCENTAGPVLTLQAVPPDEIITDSSGRLLDTRGAVIPVLHQYDRHPGHRDRLIKLLAG